MFFKRIESTGLAHYSYMIGDKGKMVVIDPKRDIEVYLEVARQEGLSIDYILETHRNEDYIVGSLELSIHTGAKIYISDHEDLGHVYGEKIRDGFKLEFGDLIFKALHTPGHTLGHLSFALYETDRSTPYMVFTGDSLFIGDLARSDFYGEEKLEEMTGLLYDSVFEKLLPLGDDVIVMPAHGAGSACGQSMEERPYSTIGYEKKYNKQLQDESKEAFINRFGTMRVRPKYFDEMRRYNVKGAEPLGLGMRLNPISLEQIEEEDILILDCRPKESYYGGHIPGSLHMSLDNLSAFLGTVIDLNTPIALMVDEGQMDVLADLYFQSRRIGIENIRGFLTNGINRWEISEKNLDTLGTITPEEFLSLETDYTLLDIRKETEKSEKDPKKNRISIPLEYLAEKYEEIPMDKPVYVLCASGSRSATGASLLKKYGYESNVISGGILAMRKII